MGSTSDKPDFEAFWRRIAPRVHAAVSRHHSRDLALAADDLVQEVRIRVWKTWSGDNNSRLRTSYYYRVINSAIIDCLRAHRGTLARATREEGPGEEDLVDTMASHTPGPDARFEQDRRGERLLAAMNSLPADRRRAVALYLQGFGVAEIAELLGCDRNRAHNLAYRGIRALREMMDEES